MVLPKRTRRFPKYLEDYICGAEIHGIIKRYGASTVTLNKKKKDRQKQRSKQKLNKKLAKKSKKPVLDKVKKKKKKAKKATYDDSMEDTDRKPPSGYIWQFYDNGWYNYDIDASEVVEKQYQSWLKNPGDFDVRSVHSGQFHYMVDFRQMKQQNIEHENHTVRDIRRVQWNENVANMFKF